MSQYSPQEEELAKSYYATKNALEHYQDYLQGFKPQAKIEFVEAEDFADYDYYVIFDREINHRLEVKCRRHKYGTYLKEKMPLRKHATAYWFKQQRQEATFYLVAWTDRIGLLKLWEQPDIVTDMVARHDRGEARDIYALYDIERFKIIATRDFDWHNFKPPTINFRELEAKGLTNY